MKKQLLINMGFLSLLLLIGACAPTAAPTPAPIAASPTIAPIVAPTATPALSAEAAAWQKVIEAAQKEGKVTLYSFGFISDVGVGISRAFKNRYGITVDIISGSGSQLMPRIESENRAGQSVADILEGAALNAILAKSRRLTQPYGNLPELQSDKFTANPRYDKEGHIIAYIISIKSPWINTKLVKPGEEPKLWKDFLDPRWRGKLVVTEPDTMPIPSQYYIMHKKYLGFDDSYYRELGKQALINAPTQRDNDSIVARGEAPITLTSSFVSLGSMAGEGAPVKPLDMVDGVAASGVAINIIANAPHPNAARLFLNWILSPEGQGVHGEARHVMPMRSDVPDFTAEAVRIRFTKIILLNQEDDEAASQAQRDKVISKMWKQ